MFNLRHFTDRLARSLGLGAAVALFAACGTTASTAPATAVPSTHITSASTPLGTVLTDSAGFTLYYFLPEKGSTLVCSGSCVGTWPQVTSTGSPTAGSGVPGSLSTIPGPGGIAVVTYNGWPLHNYTGDNGPAQTHGQGAGGGKWFVALVTITPDGAPAVGSAPTAAATAASTAAAPAPTLPAATAAPTAAPTVAPTLPPYTYPPY